MAITADYYIDSNSPYFANKHDGANNAATLSDSTANFGGTDNLVGLIVENITDGSSATITANTTTTITGTLSGGTDNDWDTTDDYRVAGTALNWANAAPNFEELVEIIYNPFPADSVIFLANNHDADYNKSVTIVLGNFAYRPLLISVDPADDSYSPGADEVVGPDTYIQNFSWGIDDPGITLAGISLGSLTSQAVLSTMVATRIMLHECTIYGGTSINLNNQDGHFITLNDCKIRSNSATVDFYCRAGSKDIFDNLTAHATHVKLNNLIDPGGAGGTDVEVYNTDLSTIMATGGGLITNHVSGADFSRYVFRNCRLPTSWTLFGTAPVMSNYRVDISSCSTADNYEYFYFEDGSLGTVEIDTAQYLSDTYDGTTNFSIQFDTYATVVNPFHPLKYKIGSFVGQTLTVSKTITVELSGPSGLTDADVWLIVVVQDATYQSLGKKYTTFTADPVTGGSALSSSSAVWNITTATEYKIDLVIPALAGITNSNVEIYLCVGKPSVAALNVAMPTMVTS